MKENTILIKSILYVMKENTYFDSFVASAFLFVFLKEHTVCHSKNKKADATKLSK